MEVKIELNSKVELKGFKRKEREKGWCKLQSCLKGFKQRNKTTEGNQRASKIKMRGKKRLIVMDAVREPVGAGAELVEVIEEEIGRHIICCGIRFLHLTKIWVVNAQLLTTRRELSPAC